VTVTGPLAVHRPPASRILPDRYFYGWYVAGACTVMMFVTVGVGYYGLSVFLRPLQVEHGWSNIVVSGATGMYFVLSGVSAFAAGPFIDRLGPRRFMIAGILLTTVGTAAIGWVAEVWHLYAAYALMAVAFGMGSAVSVSSMLSRWFIEHRSKAMTISSTGVSLGGSVLVPVGTALVGRGGLELAAPILGLLVSVVALPVLLLVVATDPAHLGLRPDGRTTDDVDTSSARHRAQYRIWTRAAAARTVTFWALLGGFALTLAAQTAVLIHQLSFLQEPGRLGSRNAAALAVTTTAIGSIVARLVVGLVADGLDKRRMTSGLFALQAVAVFAYVQVSSTVGLYAVALLFGFTIGNVYLMQSLLVGELFGLVSFGTVFGVVSLAGQLGSGVGLVVIGWLHDRTGGYGTPFTVFAVLDVLAAVVVLAARPLRAAADQR